MVTMDELRDQLDKLSDQVDELSRRVAPPAVPLPE
jgi:tetrahydromethanopterin S-methyltransferase subunit B